MYFFTMREFTSYYFAVRKSCFILAYKLFVVNSELYLSLSAEFNDVTNWELSKRKQFFIQQKVEGGAKS
jgi:hypothetical protein